jgi:hypothetical protein
MLNSAGTTLKGGKLRNSLFRLTLSALALAVVPAFAQLNIDTISSWNGTSFISSFGVPNTATYGQTITVPAGGTVLNGYSVEIGQCSASVTFRGSVYAWNGTMATGAALFSSSTQSVPADASYHLVSFNTGSLNLPAGQYVLFASTSADQGSAPPSACRWGALPNDTTYTGGNFVYLNNTADTTLWTTSAWSNIAEDLAFRVNSAPVSVPAVSTTGLLAAVLLLAAAGAVTLRRRQQTCV